jgi:dTDP-4-amino-4,6-dideoxygalactose transaminase
MILYEDLKKVNQRIIPDYISLLSTELQKGWYILGSQVQTFESNFAVYHNVPFCVGVANGLDALILGLKVFDFPSGSEVLVPSNTYIATILSIVQCGLTPVLVEPNLDDYLIDVTKIESNITSKTVAIMPVHLYGKVCDMNVIMNLAKQYDLKVIEDCAQAHGATFHGKQAGTFGEIGAFSFYPTKNLGALGDAGAILVQDEVLYEKLKALRNYGSEQKYYNKYLGLNSRLDEVQAIFLNLKLPFLAQINSHKQRLAQIYDTQIVNDLIIKPVPYVSNCENVFHIYPIRSVYRDELKSYLLAHHIGTEIHYPVAPHQQEGYKTLLEGSFPISEYLHSHLLSLPISFAHTEEEIYHVCDVLNQFRP